MECGKMADKEHCYTGSLYLFKDLRLKIYRMHVVPPYALVDDSLVTRHEHSYLNHS